MATLLALLSALTYGSSDFAAGLAARRSATGPVTAIVQACGLVCAAVAVGVVPGVGPTASTLGWGAVAGVGGAAGTLALYRGLATGMMAVVATVSGVLTAVLPAVVGLATGDHLGVPALSGIAVAVPAIGLVSWQPRSAGEAHAASGVGYGVIAGMGFALAFIALDQAGTHSGAWPLLPSQAVALLVTAPFARGLLDRRTRPDRRAGVLAVGAGVLAVVANLSFLAATGRGQLAVVAVISAMYPAATVLLARAVLAERWTRLQAAGLVTAAAAVALVSS